MPDVEAVTCAIGHILVGLLLALYAATASYQGAALISPSLLDTWDVWFQTDFPRVYSNMTDR